MTGDNLSNVRRETNTHFREIKEILEINAQ
jgi:hypothetical protein